MQFVHFTRPDGRTVPIPPAAIGPLREPLKGEMDPRAKTVISLSGGGFQAVRETMAEIEAKLANS